MTTMILQIYRSKVTFKFPSFLSLKVNIKCKPQRPPPTTLKNTTKIPSHIKPIVTTVIAHVKGDDCVI